MPILTKQRETPDRTLVQKAQEGSREAFGQLVTRHHQAVRCFLGRYLANPDDVDEVAQEVFMTAMQGVVRFERKSTFKTWLLSIARNKAIDRLRRTNKQPNTSATSPDRIDQIVVESQLQKLVGGEQDEEQLDALQNCLSQLTDEHRELVQQVYFDGVRAADVAKETGRRRNSVRMRLMRIRKALLSCIKKNTVS